AEADADDRDAQLPGLAAEAVRLLAAILGLLRGGGLRRPCPLDSARAANSTSGYNLNELMGWGDKCSAAILMIFLPSLPWARSEASQKRPQSSACRNRHSATPFESL